MDQFTVIRAGKQGLRETVGASLDSVNTNMGHINSNCLLRVTAFDGTLNN